jgi:hypothetical protein
MYIPQTNAAGQTISTRSRKSLRPAQSIHIKQSDLLNALIQHFGIKNDAALARVLELAPPMISKLRGQVLPISAFVLIRMHEVSGISIVELRGMMGDYRRKFGVSDDDPPSSMSGAGCSILN